MPEARAMAALRAIEILHSDEHFCGFLDAQGPLLWTAMLGPCPTLAIAQQALIDCGTR